MNRHRNTDCPTGHCAGFDPATIDADRYPGPPLDDVWQAALEASIAEAHQLLNDCGVDDCGNRSCDRCGERLMCTGPEPAATCPAHIECVDCEADNPCRDCAEARRVA